MNTHIPVLSDEEILAPTEALIIDGNRYVDCLYQHRLDQYIKDPVKGLWLPWSKEVYLPEDTYVVYDNGLIEGEDIIDLNEVIQTEVPVLGKQQNRVYPPDYFKKVKGRLKPQPSYPIEMVNLIYAQVRQYLFMLAPVNRKFDVSQKRVSDYIKQEVPITSELLDTIEIALDDLFLIINEFIGKDCNHLIHSRAEGTNIVIEKLVDYRIFDWNRMMRQQLEPDDE